MSRIGKIPIIIPKAVTVQYSKNNVTVNGPKGELSREINPDISVKINDGTISLERPTNQKNHKALHGLYRALINNMVNGVSNGYKKELELVGVGYKASVSNNVLEMNLGYSHTIYFALPKEIKVTAEMLKGKSPKVTIEGIDKQLVGQVTAKIRALRKIDPYKGKGIKFVGEKIRRKAGKTGAK